MYYEHYLRIVWNGPQIRSVEMYGIRRGELDGQTTEERIDLDYNSIEDGLITEPCDPRCEGLRSFCCALQEQVIYLGLFSIGNSWPDVLFHCVSQYIEKENELVR